MALKSNPFRPLINQIPAPFRNKYFIVLIFFAAWMIFFDRHDLLTQWSLQKSLNKLEEDKTFYQEKLVEAKVEKEEILQNKGKYAREQFYMQESDEDVFIIVEKK